MNVVAELCISAVCHISTKIGHHRPDLKRKPSVRRRKRLSNRTANLQRAASGGAPGAGSSKGITKTRSTSFCNDPATVVFDTTAKKEDSNDNIQLVLAPEQINSLLRLLSQTSVDSDGDMVFNADHQTGLDLDQIKQLSSLLGYLTKILGQ